MGHFLQNLVQHTRAAQAEPGSGSSRLNLNLKRLSGSVVHCILTWKADFCMSVSWHKLSHFPPPGFRMCRSENNQDPGGEGPVLV